MDDEYSTHYAPRESDELAAIRERRAQREAYHSEFGDTEPPARDWWPGLLLKQALVVAVLLGLVFAVRGAAPEKFNELRETLDQQLSVSMEWAEIFAQISAKVQEVFSAQPSTPTDESAESPSAPANASVDEPELTIPREDAAPSTAIGGETLPAATGLSFAPLWISTPAVTPVVGRISSPFGLRVHPFTGVLGYHTGTDIAAAEGTPIRAAWSGTVVAAVLGDATAGNYLVLDHGGGFRSFYGHASVLLVGEGDSVTAGDTIAKVGNTGESTGPHLHFEIRLNGVKYNALSILE
jgi:murein DD-endopeptidase MepM/ murein hydrolase activator NlpD